MLLVKSEVRFFTDCSQSCSRISRALITSLCEIGAIKLCQNIWEKMSMCNSFPIFLLRLICYWERTLGTWGTWGTTWSYVLLLHWFSFTAEQYRNSDELLLIFITTTSSFPAFLHFFSFLHMWKSSSCRPPMKVSWTIVWITLLYIH